MERIVVIDGNSLVFRAYYAMQTPMITSRGVYTQAVFGFLNMLLKAVEDNAPDYIAVCFDRKAPTFRHLEYEGYKAGRPKTPNELSMQLPYIKDILAAMRIPILELDGYEADDLIGAVCRRAEQAGLEALVITGDRDELQLVSERVSVLITKKGVSDFELNTPASMREKYGFDPAYFVDYKGLMGDSSDNIPGLPGVGEKTAQKLIAEYGSIENILAHTAELKPDRIRTIVEENGDLAVMSKRLATIVTDAPIEIDFEDMRIQPWDVAKLRNIYTELEFRMFLKKLDAYTKKMPAAECSPAGISPAVPEENIEISIIQSKSEWDAAQTALAGAEGLTLKLLGDDGHVETPLVYAIIIMVKQTAYVVHSWNEAGLLRAAAAEILKLVTNGARLSGFSLQEDLYKLLTIARGGGAADPFGQTSIRDDAHIAHYLLAPSAGGLSLAQIALTHAGLSIPEPPHLSGGLLAVSSEEICAYARGFCTAVRALTPLLRTRLESEGLLRLYEDVELPLILSLASTEVNGFAFDAGALSDIDREIILRVDQLTAVITELAGVSFNINSPKQLGEVLFERIGLPGAKKNKNGFSTSADVLEKLRDTHPIIEKILEYRMLTKLKSTYIDGLPAFVSEDGRIRCHLQQTVTATGRLSCTDPNLQNIPVRQEPGRSLRKAFVPGGADTLLMGADYSQIELRILAHLSEDPSLLADFESGADIHQRTAARVFGVGSEDAVTGEQRSAAKAVNFGIIYGISSFGLSENLSITRADAERYIAEYFEKYPAVKAYLDGSVAEAKALGYTTTIFGRRRAVPEITASNYSTRQFGERLAMNSPIQGAAADIMKIAMNRVYARLRAEGLKTEIILQVHDELILEVPADETETAARVLKEEMEGAAILKVPLLCQVKTGHSWYELK